MILHNSGSVLSLWQRKQKGQYAVQPTMPVSEYLFYLCYSFMVASHPKRITRFGRLSERANERKVRSNNEAIMRRIWNKTDLSEIPRRNKK